MTETFNFTAKEVFDLITTENELSKATIKSLKDHNHPDHKEQKRKTFVISKRALSILNKTSNNYKVSRDLLVERTNSDIQNIYGRIAREGGRTRKRSS
ncbi:MAG: hypothetical protein U5K72_02165 [Balneolaceae bacterium]|nr:hypothetical protein [Balneolaceae bacterium]